MDDRFDALTEAQQTEVMNFLQITGTEDVNTAISYMEMSQFDVSSAVNLYFTSQETGGLISQPQNSTPQPQQQQRSQQTSTSQLQRQQRSQQSINSERRNGDPLDEKLKEYRRFLARKQEEEDNSIMGNIKRIFQGTMKRVRQGYNALMPLAIRGETPGGEEFIVSLRAQYPNINTLNFQTGLFQENYETAHAKKTPLLVYIHMEGSQTDPQLIKSILTNQQLRTFVSTSFWVLGLNGRSDESMSLTREIPSTNFPCFGVFRTTLLERKQVVGIIPITASNTDVEGFYLEGLKRLKQRFFIQLSEDDQVRTSLKNRHQRQIEQRNNFFNEHLYGIIPQPPPLSQIEQDHQRAVIEQDRFLRETQEEAFREAERQAASKESARLDQENKLKAEESKKALKEEERQKTIEKKRGDLPEEPSKSNPNAFTFAFRVPDGSRVSRRFLKTQRIQLLFDFIECREEVEFENDERKFDLIQTFPPLSLLEHINKTINEVFPDSVQEIIIVKEL